MDFYPSLSSMKKLYSYVIFLTLSSLSLLLSACGFHLRGQGHSYIPPQLKVLYVTSQTPYDTLTKQVKQTLISLGVTLKDSADQAPYTLVLYGESQSQMLMGSGTNNQLESYQLIYGMAYSIKDSKGREIQAPRAIRATRNFTSNPNQALSQNYEQLSLIEDMRQDVINQMLNQLSTRQTLQALTPELASSAK